MSLCQFQGPISHFVHLSQTFEECLWLAPPSVRPYYDLLCNPGLRASIIFSVYFLLSFTIEFTIEFIEKTFVLTKVYFWYYCYCLTAYSVYYTMTTFATVHIQGLFNKILKLYGTWSTTLGHITSVVGDLWWQFITLFYPPHDLEQFEQGPPAK